MKKIAIVATHPVQYNAPWFKLLAQKTGYTVKVFYTWSQTQEGPKYDPDFGKVIEWDIPLLEGYDYEFVENTSKAPGSHHFRGISNPSLNKQIKEWGPDAILVIGWSYKSHLSCLRYFKGKVPVLFRGDSTLLNEKPGLKKIARRLFLKYVYSFVDYALYVGTHNKNYYLAHGLKEKQLVFAPHAIDNDRFSVPGSAELASEWRNSLGIGEENFVILYAGKLEEKKNPGAVLDIAAVTTSGNLRFVIVGNGPMEKELKAKALHDKRIIFIDFQNQKKMPVVYHLGNVLLMPSKSETWGLGVNEAMACGLPVLLSSNVGGAIDLIKNNGAIFSLEKLETAKEFIEELESSRQHYLSAKKASLEHIKSFSFDHIATAVEMVCGL